MTVSHTIWLASDHGNVPLPASPAHDDVPLELPEVLPLLEPEPPLELDVPDPLVVPEPDPELPLLVPELPLLVPDPLELPEVAPLELPPLEPLAELPLLEVPLPLEPLDAPLVEPPLEPVPALPLVDELSPQPVAAVAITREIQPRRRTMLMRSPGLSSHTLVLWSSGLTVDQVREKSAEKTARSKACSDSESARQFTKRHSCLNVPAHVSRPSCCHTPSVRSTWSSALQASQASMTGTTMLRPVSSATISICFPHRPPPIHVPDGPFIRFIDSAAPRTVGVTWLPQ
jgi:hypothetical protein